MKMEGFSLDPIAGIIRPEETLPIHLYFVPSKRGEHTFDLKCFVEKIKTPLELSISANCFEVQVSVNYVNKEGSDVELVPNKSNVVDLGAMFPHQCYETRFKISNVGRMGFEWRIVLDTKKIDGFFNIFFDDLEGILLPGSEGSVLMSIEPVAKNRLASFNFKLDIPYGPCYYITLKGHAEKPPYKFSFSTYNFGKVLVQKETSKAYHVTLYFSNHNTWPITLEKGEHEKHVSSNFSSSAIMPERSEPIKIFFHPMVVGQHSIKIPFFINGEQTSITICGIAVNLQVELLEQNDKFIDMGSVLIGKTYTKTIRVINKSDCALNIIFDFWERLPIHHHPEVPSKILEMPPDEPKTVASTKKGKKNKGKKSQRSSKTSSKKSKKLNKKKGKDKASMKTKRSKKSKTTKKTKKSKSSKKSKTSKSSKSSKKGKKKEKKEEPEVIPPKPIDFITITDNKFMKLLPHKIADFTVKFTPLERLDLFTEKIFYQVQDYTEALCLLQGRAIAAECSLDRNNITFGNVVVGFESTMNVTMKNTGDVNLKFKWVLGKDASENFTISPKKGHVLAGTTLIFDISFKPKVIKCWIKAKLICNIELVKDLELILSGSCIALPPPQATLTFNCPVRESEKKSVSLSNPANIPWQIRPQITGCKSFKCQDVMHLEPDSHGNCEVTFSPMKTEEQTAILFCPLPDGLVITYSIKGHVLPPLAAGKIRRDILAKTAHTEILTVKNWLQTSQKFTVTTTNNIRTNKMLYTISSNPLLDVPGNGARTYRWIIEPINEGTLDLKVIFTNQITGEFLFFEIALNVLTNMNMKTINFSTCVRLPIEKTIKLENPVNIPVVYSISCPQDNLIFDKTITMEPHTIHHLQVKYNPLKPENVVKILEASCKELGTFFYNLKLIAHTAVPETATHFKTYLGQSIAKKIKVITVHNASFEFEDGHFSLVPRSESSDSDHSIIVHFEPSRVGKIQSRMLLKTSEQGEFSYPLLGECLLPQPQGPFIIKLSQPLTIIFKNPFNEQKMFNFRVHPLYFRVKSGELLGPSKTTKLVVTLLNREKLGPSTPYKFPMTGKLTISCRNPEVVWDYYLREDKD